MKTKTKTVQSFKAVKLKPSDFSVSINEVSGSILLDLKFST